MQAEVASVGSLQQAIREQNHHLIYQLSMELLSRHPNDHDYLYCFILSAIRSSSFKQLQTGIFKSSPTHENLSKLYAYYLYTNGDFLNAIKYIESQKQDYNFRLLLSQCYFKILNYDKSAEITSALMKECKLSKDDRQLYTVNLFGTGINKILTQKSLKDYNQIIGKGSSKEILYNYSLILYELGHYEESLMQLKKFQDMLDSKVDLIDIASADVLRNVIYYKADNIKGNQNLLLKYQQYLSIDDVNLKGVLQCNILSINEAQQLNDAFKTIENCMSIHSKVSRTQLITLKINKLSILLKKNKLVDAQKIVKELETSVEQPHLYSNQEYIKSKYYLMKKNKQWQEIEHLIQHLKQHYSQQLSFYIQIDYAKERNLYDQLIQYLTKQPNPIITNYIFSILLSNPNLLTNHSHYLTQLSKNTTDITVLHKLLQFYEKMGNRVNSSSILQRILNIDPKNLKAKLKFAKILIEDGNTAKAEELLKGIDPPQQINDMGYLHNIEKNIHISIQKQQQLSQVNKQNIKKKIHKKKKIRLPKGVKAIDGFKPDPQRWLPKWQRKGYKKKGKKTQGLATVSKQETKNTFTTGKSTGGKEVTKDNKKKRH